jgi:DNA recombination protein RmuC
MSTAAVALGVLIGLVAGAAAVLVLHVRRQGTLLADARAAEARRSDAQESAARLAAKLEGAERSLAEALAEQARLSADLDHERRAARERAAAWEEDRKLLEGSFAKLSSDALAHNNEQFLLLAESRMREAQKAAAGDLAQRQQAISELLRRCNATRWACTSSRRTAGGPTPA